MALTLDELRRFAVARSLFEPTTLRRAIRRLGFIQADPIRAPARAQDLVLRQRVNDYHAGDLERLYAKLGLEEDFFVNYGFLAPEFWRLMHPRSGLDAFSKARARQAQQVLKLVLERGAVHPREVDAHFGSGTERNWWGGSSNTTTRLLDALHFRGMLRVARRERGVRIYAPQTLLPARVRAEELAMLDALIDVAVRKYAPLPAASLSHLIRRLRYGAPQWRGQLGAAVLRAKDRLASGHAAGTDWFWPAEEAPLDMVHEREPDDRARLLAPFDPVVWDRRRFELFWNWAYRFEAYTPVSKRKLGYYALPLLWRDHVIGWGNLSFEGARLSATFGYVAGKAPRSPSFRHALGEELERIERFLSPRQGT
jgi:uncharacterized protein YcaQ